MLLWSLKMLNSKLVISLSKNSFLALKNIIFLIDLRIRNLKQNVKMSDQSNIQLGRHNSLSSPTPVPLNPGQLKSQGRRFGPIAS